MLKMDPLDAFKQNTTLAEWRDRYYSEVNDDNPYGTFNPYRGPSYEKILHAKMQFTDGVRTVQQVCDYVCSTHPTTACIRAKRNIPLGTKPRIGYTFMSSTCVFGAYCTVCDSFIYVPTTSGFWTNEEWLLCNKCIRKNEKSSQFKIVRSFTLKGDLPANRSFFVEGYFHFNKTTPSLFRTEDIQAKVVASHASSEIQEMTEMEDIE